MDVAVIGGTGTVGRRTADHLESRGHIVRRVSRRGGSHRADVSSGDGLEAALEGVEAVVNASNSPSARRASAGGNHPGRWKAVNSRSSPSRY